MVFFIVREPWVLGWDATGEGMDRARAASLQMPLDTPSVFPGVTRPLAIGRARSLAALARAGRGAARIAWERRDAVLAALSPRRRPSAD